MFYVDQVRWITFKKLTSLLQSVMESSEIAKEVTKCYVDYSSTEKERVRFEQKFLVLLQF